MAQIRADEIASVLREEIEGFDQAIQVAETATWPRWATESRTSTASTR